MSGTLKRCPDGEGIETRDVETNEIHFYAGREPDFIGNEVSEKHYDHVGSVKP